jgi:NADP-dependent 3-hydroxy acid dehydrogenase YdfG
MFLKNKTAYITGASRGIGAALAIGLSKHEMNLALVARNKEDLEKIQTECIENGSRCIIFAIDLKDESAIKNSITEVTQNQGWSIDFLVNNAGFGIMKSVIELEVEEWDDMMSVNSKSNFLTCKSIVPTMQKQKSGHVINVASDVAKRTFANGSGYCASKYAQHALSDALRKEVRKDNIKVSVIYSGLVDSHFHVIGHGHEHAASWLKEKDMADAILYVMNTPAHVVIDELMIHPLSQEY